MRPIFLDAVHIWLLQGGLADYWDGEGNKGENGDQTMMISMMIMM